MLARLRNAQDKKDSGFTLIELLVVMIIIGILAAIAVPVFLNQRAKARETSAKSDVTTIGKEVAAYYVDGTGNVTLATAGSTWTLTDATANAQITTGSLSSGNTARTVAQGTAGAWCVQVGTNDNPAKIWRYQGGSNANAAQGLSQGACA
ncbi:prepilin-type N-terminal cleavage/methylation domain-containing protein [Motilibacter aurantiacus]|uniref:prepilin-type N-terminal cleavage/methylation domain-containing protein n=1 Tax=Motilibacter aurantiacus TaxID=2714955 RepID=UPI0014098F75|nr:prepilin-type N-terminal cleavage/methylation domain-containing protein [Motilibacter aurantiacus]NHC46017.1 prepilin-type N-terminal cleavage/methylation domain-containing protein [Motilibacter aurantiacus]